MLTLIQYHQLIDDDDDIEDCMIALLLLYFSDCILNAQYFNQLLPDSIQ